MGQAGRRQIALVGAALGLAAIQPACGEDSPTFGKELRSSEARIAPPVVSADDGVTLASDNLAFAVDLHQALRGGAGNLVSSPTSISLALAMLYGGARGTTAQEIATALHFTLPPERLHPAFDALDLALESAPTTGVGTFRLSLANAVWGQDGATVLPEYLDLLATSYGAGLHVVDFAGDTEGARSDINGWVSQQTQAKIPELLPAGVLDSLTRLVLTNAVAFQGDWQTPFKPSTGNAVFHTPAGDMNAPMMLGSAAVPIWSGAGFAAAALQYAGGTTSMVLVVPDAGTFDAFEQGLTAAGLAAIFDGRTGAPSGILAMPRFRFASDVDLRGTLMTLGMVQAFEAGQADLSGINGGSDLYVKATLHKAIITVDETGTEAAAATGVVVNTKSATVPALVANRPFVFFIRHDPTGAILFAGRVLDPTQ